MHREMRTQQIQGSESVFGLVRLKNTWRWWDREGAVIGARLRKALSTSGGVWTSRVTQAVDRTSRHTFRGVGAGLWYDHWKRACKLGKPVLKVRV